MKPTFSGEMQLAGWSESHNGGCKVTFWLSDPDDLEAFRAMTVRKGNTAGQRLMAALVEIGDDEQPVQPEEAPQIADKPKGGPLSKEAALLCRNEAFLLWLEFEQCIEDAATLAPEWIRQECGVLSRAELDTQPTAGQRFINNIRAPFMRWHRERVAA
jgi:hypothetical protein